MMRIRLVVIRFYNLFGSELSGLFQCCHVCLFLLSVIGLLRPRQLSSERD